MSALALIVEILQPTSSSLVDALDPALAWLWGGAAARRWLYEGDGVF